ncbi:Hypothetical protein D9617_5g069880 [Elsinoe fawcettii]|nr:Hypothetical protein D9617_5g069880 [Elsinoe fawcettii]
MQFNDVLLAFFAASALAAPQGNANDPKNSVVVSFSGKKPAAALVPIPPAEGEKLDLSNGKRDGVAILTKIAIEIGADTIKNLGQWKRVREEFTQKTSQEMWNKNPDYRKYPAVACYNKGFTVRDWNGIAGKVSAKLSLGMLNIDYDCMYIAGPNAFWTRSDGGYINLSYRYNPQRCSFDQRTGDLTCK